jgi:hypothetical protein
VNPFLLLFIAVCAFLLLQGMLKRGAIYQFPFLAGAVFAGWALPQLIGLSNESYLPPGAFESTLLMASLCGVMSWLGAVAAGPPYRKPVWVYDDSRLLLVSAILSVVGAYFFYAITQLPEDLTGVSNWTGLPVVYVFFARLLTYGFAIAVLLFARSRSRVALLIALFCAVFYFDRIVIGGRRQETGEFVMIILLAWCFQRDRCVPRPLMLAGLVIGGLFVNSIGEYRSASGNKEGPKWDEIANIDFVGNLQKLTEHGGPELMNAAYIIAAVGRTMEFDLGTSHWNDLVFSYVPAQLVGTEFKEALYFPQSSPAYDEFFYTPMTGTTVLGLSDAYASFWYFGCLEFFGIAYCMQKLWWAARGGSFLAQLLYMLMPMSALETITHGTDSFLMPWVHIAAFLLPPLYFARRGRPPARRRPSGPPLMIVPLWSGGGRP